MTALVAGGCLALACLLVGPVTGRLLPESNTVAAPAASQRDPTRFRLLAVIGAFVGGATFVPLPWGIGVGGGAATVVWVLLDRAESPEARRHREQAERDLPDVVQLLGVALASGTPLSGAVHLVARVRPGPAADAVAAAERRLSLGLPWEGGEQAPHGPGFARLGRALTRSMRSGAPIADTVARLSTELAAQRRLAVADRARTVGVRAAVPLGVCLLPAFILLGIVPVVVASLQSLPW